MCVEQQHQNKADLKRLGLPKRNIGLIEHTKESKETHLLITCTLTSYNKIALQHIIIPHDELRTTNGKIIQDDILDSNPCDTTLLGFPDLQPYTYG